MKIITKIIPYFLSYASIGFVISSGKSNSTYFIKIKYIFGFYKLFVGLKEISEKRQITIVTFYYQQPGDTKKPYFAQYSAVCEDAPVRVS